MGETGALCIRDPYSTKQTHITLHFLLLIYITSPRLAQSAQHLTKIVRKSQTYDLDEDIFTDYKRHIRPSHDIHRPTVVTVSINPMAVNDLDAQKQTLSQTLFMEITWADDFLAWNRTQYGGAERLVLPQENVWLPDLVVGPFSESMKQLGYDELPVQVDYTGEVHWQPSGVFVTHCAIDITYYPFDQQHCELRLRAWTSNVREIVLQTNRSTEISPKFYVQNSEWELLRLHALIENITSKNEEYSSLVLHYTLRRRPTFFALTVVIPDALLAILSSLVFALPVESGEKMSLSMTVFLTFVFWLSIVMNVLPHSSLQLSVHVMYLVLMSTCSALSVLFSLFVVEIYHRSERTHPVGPWWIALVRCTRRMGIRRRSFRMHHFTFQVYNQKDLEKGKHSRDRILDSNDNDSSVIKDGKETHKNFSELNTTHISAGNFKGKTDKTEVNSWFRKRSLDDRNQSPTRNPGQDDDKITWKCVAQSLDFIMLRLFLSVAGIMIIICLIMKSAHTSYATNVWELD